MRIKEILKFLPFFKGKDFEGMADEILKIHGPVALGGLAKDFDTVAMKELMNALEAYFVLNDKDFRSFPQFLMMLMISIKNKSEQ